MKKYVSCFLFFLCLTGGCLITLFFMTISLETDEAQEVQVTESVEQPAFAERAAEPQAEMETETMVHLVLNQESVLHETTGDKYCLVAEEGYLIIYDDTRETVNMFTHMPLADFPVEEQERLMEGIWFATMAEVFSYLESYTS